MTNANRGGVATMGRPKKAETSESTIRVPDEVANLLRHIATYENRAIGDIVREVMLPVLQPRYEAHVKRAHDEIVAKERGSSKKKPG